MKTVLCYSGGLDSTIAREFLKPDDIVYFDLGTEYSAKEMARLPAWVTVIKVKMPIPEFGITKHIPFRNIMFAELAYNAVVEKYATEDIIQVAIIGVEGDDSEDKSENAFKVMSAGLNAIKHAGTPYINIMSPFWKKTKGQLVAWLKGEHPTAYLEILRNVVSCYSETGGRCGKCPACYRFWVALAANGINTDGWFEADVKAGAAEYYKDKVYDSPQRNAEIKVALGRKG